MANPQKEDGYVGIANELFEAIYMKFDFTKRQLRILSAIIRHSYGWNRNKCSLSLREISSQTGIDFRHVSSALQELIEMSVLFVEGFQNEKRTYILNKDYDTWSVTKTVTGVSPKRQHKSHQNGDTRVTETATHTIKRQYKDRERQHAPEFLSLWAEYPEIKRDGLEWVKEDDEKEVLDNIELVRSALHIYLESVKDEQFLMKAEKFFRGKWKAYAPDEKSQKQRTRKGGRFE